jgi:hypothetical protein
MNDFFWIIIVIAIVGSIISGVRKKKAREEAARRAATQGQQQEQPQAPRSVPLSDIQKAFMMAQNSGQRPTYTPPPQAAPRPAYTPPKPVSQPAYEPVQATTYTTLEARMTAPMEARSTTPMEARSTAPMEARSTAPMEARSTAPMEARSATPMASRAMYAAQDIYGGSMNAVSREGTTDEEGSGSPFEALKVANLQSVTDADLETLTGLSAPVRPVRQAAPERPARTGLPRLFENKNEYIKAILYSEILARRTTGRRA